MRAPWIVVVFALAACGQDPTSRTSAGTVEQALREFNAERDPGLVWELLPRSYQEDVRRWCRAIAGVVPAPAYDKTFVALRKAGVVIKTKSEFIVTFGPLQFARRFFGNAGEEDLHSVLTALGNTLILLGKSEVATSTGLAALEPGRLLHGTGKQVYAQVRRAWRVTGREPDAALRDLVVRPVEESGDHARVQVVRDGEEPTDLVLTRIDGRWVPQEIVSRWAAWSADIEGFLARARAADFGDTVRAYEDLLDRLLQDLETLAAADSRTKFTGELQKMIARYKKSFAELR